jgi:hypothetical protein
MKSRGLGTDTTDRRVAKGDVIDLGEMLNVAAPYSREQSREIGDVPLAVSCVNGVEKADATTLHRIAIAAEVLQVAPRGDALRGG